MPTNVWTAFIMEGASSGECGELGPAQQAAGGAYLVDQRAPLAWSLKGLRHARRLSRMQPQRRRRGHSKPVGYACLQNRRPGPLPTLRLARVRAGWLCTLGARGAAALPVAFVGPPGAALCVHHAIHGACHGRGTECAQLGQAASHMPVRCRLACFQAAQSAGHGLPKKLVDGICKVARVSGAHAAWYHLVESFGGLEHHLRLRSCSQRLEHGGQV